MKPGLRNVVALLIASSSLTACASPGKTLASPTQEKATMQQNLQASPIPPVVTSGELAPTGDPAKAPNVKFLPPEWPLRFREHNFGARCYDTLECSVVYDDFEHGGYRREEPSPSSASKGPDYLKGWNGGYGSVSNFPPPARVIWTSKDGSRHEAEIDIGEIFKDQVVLHYVPREELADLPDGRFGSDPSILLEVNDRTIRVYMRAMVFTKHFQRPPSRHSDFRNDLILVRTYAF